MDIKNLKKDEIALLSLVVFFILYLLTKQTIFAVLTALSFFASIILDIVEGAKETGWKEQVRELAITLLALAIIWFGIRIILNTNSPLNAVVSCSMLPNLERGDVVIVRGLPIETAEINLTKEEFENIGNVYYEYEGKNYSIKGSIYSYCIFNKDPICEQFVNDPGSIKEWHGPLLFEYQKCLRDGEGTIVPCLKDIEYKGTKYNSKGDIVVYVPKKEDIFGRVGNIVHRAILKINVDGKYYYIIKGDNNEIADMQIYDYNNNIGNSIVEQNQVEGKVILRIPAIGYIRLFIAGQFEGNSQCKYILKPIGE